MGHAPPREPFRDGPKDRGAPARAGEVCDRKIGSGERIDLGPMYANCMVAEV